MIFWKNESTSKPLISITEDITQIVDKSMKVCSVFLDVDRLCNTVKHDILIQKLKSHGLRGQAVKLIRSYLSERNQFVQIRQNVSSTLNIQVSVPRRSVLGPLLFLVFIKDLPTHLTNKKLSLTLFADDTSLTPRISALPLKKRIMS